MVYTTVNEIYNHVNINWSNTVNLHKVTFQLVEYLPPIHLIVIQNSVDNATVKNFHRSTIVILILAYRSNLRSLAANNVENEYTRNSTRNDTVNY